MGSSDADLYYSNALRMLSGAAIVSLVALGANTAAYCARYGCRRGVPFVSKVGACERKEIATLENALVVVLVMLLAIAAVLHRSLGNFSNTQMYAALLAVPLAVVCVSFDTLQFGLLHVLLFQAICMLLLCIFTNSWLPLLILLPPVFFVQLTRKKSRTKSRSDTCPYPRNSKPFLWGPTLQVAGIVGLVGGLVSYNLRHAAAIDAKRIVV